MKNPLKFADKIGKALEDAASKKPWGPAKQKDSQEAPDADDAQQGGMAEHCPNCDHPLRVMKPAKKAF